ncbi:MAG: helix-turn-helix domain-containing protein [Candidatus Puniceispirillaceae bacterium]
MIESPALAIGQALKAEREKSNISLRDIAEHTRLSYANLTALEAGDFESLPGIGYIPGYIKNYCKAVGIDSAPHIASFKSLSNDVTKKPEYSFPVQALVPRVAGSMLAMFAVLIGLAVYVGWTVLTYNLAPDDELIASSISKPEKLAALVETEVKQFDQPTQPLAQPFTKAEITEKATDGDPNYRPQPSPPQRKAETGLVEVEQSPLLSQPEVMPNATALEAGSFTEETRTALAVMEYPAETAPLPNAEMTFDQALTGVAARATARIPEKELIIKATASAWIEVTRANGEVLVTKLMRDGDELALSTIDELFLSTGNAGGLRLEMVNLSAFDAGQTGEILRDLRLNRETLLTRRNQLAY